MNHRAENTEVPQPLENTLNYQYFWQTSSRFREQRQIYSLTKTGLKLRVTVKSEFLVRSKHFSA
jgi:hypothetical protein